MPASLNRRFKRLVSPIKPGHWSGSELPTFAKRRWEQRRIRFFPQLGNFEVFVDKAPFDRIEGKQIAALKGQKIAAGLHPDQWVRVWLDSMLIPP